jgi:hypothetical protein
MPQSSKCSDRPLNPRTQISTEPKNITKTNVESGARPLVAACVH